MSRPIEEYERSVLGQMLIECFQESRGEPTGIWKHAKDLVPEDFTAAHRPIFEAIQSTRHAGRQVNIEEIYLRMTEDDTLKGCGGLGYLCDLENKVLFFMGAPDYCKHIRAAGKTRRAMARLETVHREIAAGRPAHEALSTVAQCMELDRDDDTEGNTPLEQAYRRLEAIQTGEAEGRMWLGFEGLDAYAPATDEMLIIAARPSVGKTALAVELAHRLAMYGKRVLFVSCEMASPAVITRRVALISGVDQAKLSRKSNLTAGEWDAISKAFAQIKDNPFDVIDGVRKPAEIEAIVRDENREQHVDAVFIDHLHQIQHEAADRQDLRIGMTTKRFAAMCKDLGTACFLLAQLNRGPEARDGKMPQLSDLRDSGAIEEDADVVWLLARPGMGDMKKDQKEFDVRCAKNRNGAIGLAHLFLDAATGRFQDWPGGY